MLPDPAPNDEEHHRLRTEQRFTFTVDPSARRRNTGRSSAQPQNTGWTELFPRAQSVYAIRR